MKQQLEQRLQELKTNFAEGDQQLQQMQEKETTLRETLLRIGGAIQVLEEELAEYEKLNTATATEGDEVNMQLVDSSASGT